MASSLYSSPSVDSNGWQVGGEGFGTAASDYYGEASVTVARSSGQSSSSIHSSALYDDADEPLAVSKQITPQAQQTKQKKKEKGGSRWGLSIGALSDDEEETEDAEPLADDNRERAEVSSGQSLTRGWWES